MTPQLTIAIPTVDRPEMLSRAIKSVLSQTVPVQLIVCDQGESFATANVMIATMGHTENAQWLRTEASNLWENWRAGALACQTPYFAWLQDDDIVRSTYAARVIAAFEAFPDAACWLSRNMLAIDERLGYWTSGNGPWVPMDFQSGNPDQWEGSVLVPTSYFTSWSLSPAVAFRTGERFNRAIKMMPEGFDLFQERAILAACAYDSNFIADPCVAGLWIHHGQNESYKQHHDQPRQTDVLVTWLDSLMDQVEEWQSILDAWAKLMHPSWIVNWINQISVTQGEGHVGKYTEEVKAILMDSLKGRVEVMEKATA